MKTNRAYANTTPIKICVLLPVLFCLNGLCAQRLTTIKNTCGLYYRSMAGLKRDQAQALGFYRFTPGDTVASIGAQACNWEAAYAATTDSLFFYLEDIDTFYCNPRQAGLAWAYYPSLKGCSRMGGFATVIGSEKATQLPPKSCNKILIINSFHEFAYPGNMLRDIKTKLKPRGYLYIDELLATYPGQLHPACNKPLRTEADLVQFVENKGFAYVNSVAVAWRKNKPARKIFAFTPKQ